MDMCSLHFLKGYTTLLSLCLSHYLTCMPQLIFLPSLIFSPTQCPHSLPQYRAITLPLSSLIPSLALAPHSHATGTRADTHFLLSFCTPLSLFTPHSSFTPHSPFTLYCATCPVSLLSLCSFFYIPSTPSLFCTLPILYLLYSTLLYSTHSWQHW